jgi:hypothetical protein
MGQRFPGLDGSTIARVVPAPKDVGPRVGGILQEPDDRAQGRGVWI